MKTKVSDVIVHVTEDYNLFNKLEGNRMVNHKKVNKIKEAIEIEGIDILKYAPIIVDENFKILDGQHRFQVCKDLKRPVHFIQVNEMGIKEVAKINSNSTNWAVDDYLSTYCKLEKEAYLKVRELKGIYKANTLLIATMIHHGKIRERDIKEDFIDGTLTMIFLEWAIERLDLLKSFTHYTERPFSNRFAQAVDKLVEGGLYDHEMMLDQLNKSGIKITRLDNPKTIISQMEEIMNWHKQKRVRII